MCITGAFCGHTQLAVDDRGTEDRQARPHSWTLGEQAALTPTTKNYFAHRMALPPKTQGNVQGISYFQLSRHGRTLWVPPRPLPRSPAMSRNQAAQPSHYPHIWGSGNSVLGAVLSFQTHLLHLSASPYGCQQPPPLPSWFDDSSVATVNSNGDSRVPPSLARALHMTMTDT